MSTFNPDLSPAAGSLGRWILLADDDAHQSDEWVLLVCRTLAAGEIERWHPNVEVVDDEASERNEGGRIIRTSVGAWPVTVIRLADSDVVVTAMLRHTGLTGEALRDESERIAGLVADSVNRDGCDPERDFEIPPGLPAVRFERTMRDAPASPFGLGILSFATASATWEADEGDGRFTIYSAKMSDGFANEEDFLDFYVPSEANVDSTMFRDRPARILRNDAGLSLLWIEGEAVRAVSTSIVEMDATELKRIANTIRASDQSELEEYDTSGS